MVSAAHPNTSAGSNSQATVVIGSAPSMAATIRVAAPGLVSMSFRLGPDSDGVRLVGDVATVMVEGTGTCIKVEIGSVSVMGYVEVCEAKILAHIAGPPIEGRQERRRSERFGFSEPILVDVAPSGSHSRAVGELGDISTGGCGLRLARSAYRTVGGLMEAVLRFELPGFEQTFVLKAKRRDTRATGANTVLMGMIWSKEPGEADAHASLAEYLRIRAGLG